MTLLDVRVNHSRFNEITDFQANHCAGAVMFLIESHLKAILYTGDIRCTFEAKSYRVQLLITLMLYAAEPWWVNTIIRNPIVVPYTCGLRTLDNIYLDTTFASNTDIHRAFPTKAEGLSELLTKISRYPATTVFHFHAWTLGYEEVWIALASALGSQVLLRSSLFNLQEAHRRLDPCR